MSGNEGEAPVRVAYFSDVLCVWAWVGERRVEQLARDSSGQAEIDAHFRSVFSDARGKIETGWAERGRYEGFSRHVREVVARFPHVSAHERLWLDARPRTSASALLFLEAVALVEEARLGDAPPAPWLERLSTRAVRATRRAFFEDARDISDWKVHREIAREIGLDYDEAEARIRASEAIVRLVLDYDLARRMGVEGSPTLILDGGRQKLFGNVGYRVIEANVQELLRRPAGDEASWC